MFNMNRKSYKLYYIMILCDQINKLSWKAKKYLINRFYNLEKNSIELYIKSYAKTD